MPSFPPTPVIATESPAGGAGGATPSFRCRGHASPCALPPIRPGGVGKPVALVGPAPSAFIGAGVCDGGGVVQSMLWTLGVPVRFAEEATCGGRIAGRDDGDVIVTVTPGCRFGLCVQNLESFCFLGKPPLTSYSSRDNTSTNDYSRGARVPVGNTLVVVVVVIATVVVVVVAVS